MAAIAVTYTFSNSTTADATQVNQNFTDILNGLSDGSKDISVNAGTFAGNVSFSGNTTIGNATADDLTVTASLASSIPIKTTNSFDIGSSSLGLRALYFGANSQTVNIKGSASMSATWTLTLPVAAGTSGQLLRTNGSGTTSWVGSTPTIQRFTSSSGTYTTPANVVYLRVKMIGGGGGGAGGGTTAIGAGSTGVDTTFGSNTASAGVGASNSGGSPGGAGGATSVGTGTTVIAVSGGNGGSGSQNATLNADVLVGGQGADGAFGGGGGGGYNATGAAGKTNTGGGGGGGGMQSAAANCFSGAGGGAGGYIEAIIVSPSATYAYAVGGGGGGGTAGTNGNAGGAGGSGVIVVEEYYM